MNKLVIASLALLVLMTHGASLPKTKENHRQGKTLGLLTVATSALGSGASTAGAALGTAVGVISAVKPLLLLGLGKYWLYNHLKKKNAGAGVNVQAGNGYGVNANLGYNNQYVSNDFYTPTGPIETIWYESEPAEFDRTEAVSWKSSGDSGVATTDKRKRSVRY